MTKNSLNLRGYIRDRDFMTYDDPSARIDIQVC